MRLKIKLPEIAKIEKTPSGILGLKVDNGFTSKAIRAVGGKNGFYHLLGQVLEMAKGLSQFIDRSINLPLAENINDTPKLR